ncbi:MAG: hypothetical protein K2I03_02180 [Lachnospiraceae bacterium]|nr:hypothetical protein [Lachnospiraceae bacterium]
MNNKDIVKYFYEVIVSENLLDELSKSNKVLEITGVDIDKVINGRIVEHGGDANTFETFFEHRLIKPV